VRQSASVALTFAAAVAILVLLVTCANVAGVLHSRAAARVRETAVRYALGATRFRVVRQWLTEGVLLACVGAICGLFVQRGIHKGLASLLQTAAPQQLTTPSGTDGRVIAFTFLLALASGLTFAFLPAYRSASRGDAALRETATAVTPGRSASRTTRVLVVLQVSVCLCLLVTAGLLTRSLRNTRTFDVGFDSSGLLLAQVDLHRLGYDPARAAAFFERLASRVRVVPGVRAVSRAAVVPLGGDRERQGFRIAGHTGPGGQPTIMLDVNAVGPDYFAALGVPILRGRDFTEADTPRSQPVVIINDTMARQYWPGRSALGETIALAGGPSFEVIGVARDIKYYALDEAARSHVYVPAAQIGAAARVVHVRVDGPAAAFLNVVRREAASTDPSVTLQNVMTFEDLRQQPLVLRRAMTVLATAFGALSLLLAVVGIYGTMTNAVAQRAREIGVRMAFGAEISDVFRLVVGAGLRPVLLGLAIGLPSAGIVTRLVRSELFGVTTGDPVTHVAAAALILVTAFGTLSLPARRAARVDPVTILRHDQ
jgi:predicted permease